MNELITIQNVRGYLDENGTAHLNLEDVARGLGFVKRDHKNGKTYERMNKQRIAEWLVTFGTLRSEKENLPEYVSENIAYRLAFKGENEVAIRFQSLLADEILPVIRKHGMYVTPAKMEEMLADPDAMILALQALKRERVAKEALALENADLVQVIEEQAPKVVFADAVSDCADTILIRDLAKLLKSNGVDVGEKRLFKILREAEFLINKHGDKTHNTPTQKAMNLRLFKVKETLITHTDGSQSINFTTKVTGKGQSYFINYFLNGKDEKLA